MASPYLSRIAGFSIRSAAVLSCVLLAVLPARAYYCPADVGGKQGSKVQLTLCDGTQAVCAYSCCVLSADVEECYYCECSGTGRRQLTISEVAAQDALCFAGELATSADEWCNLAYDNLLGDQLPVTDSCITYGADRWANVCSALSGDPSAIVGDVSPPAVSNTGKPGPGAVLVPNSPAVLLPSSPSWSTITVVHAQGEQAPAPAPQLRPR
ncbi:hypothetical protein WJX72_006885 [[Myrmecia] bisecta]|uniref:Uncharacterized protein n=1 Tax=[Myrmecia] bisecta TaxID=41462 RepID=A0AAW1PTN8_9CHLO